MTNLRNTVLYTGITNDIQQRSFDHKTKRNKRSFTSKYNCVKLVYYEEFADIEVAIHREKQLKKYHRSWKEELINKMNPDWKDLSDGWFDPRELEFAKRLNQ
ncbi:MAG: GIY-YIG nuclease family protein [Cyclobacteriaceae bacterium]|nr:GIY-YIG nuclease family protein [Cyclobacteriaceae bacterium]